MMTGSREGGGGGVGSGFGRGSSEEELVFDSWAVLACSFFNVRFWPVLRFDSVGGGVVVVIVAFGK